MNKHQLLELVVRPTLSELNNGLTGEMAIMLIIAHESQRGEFIKQYPTGPAWGLIQMEEATHDCTWENGNSIWDNAVILGVITPEDAIQRIHPSVERLAYDLRYNVFMARQRLFMKPGKLPIDLNKLSKYLKTHWNSVLGAADELSYVNDYIKW